MATMAKEIDIDDIAKKHLTVTVETVGHVKFWVRVKAITFLIWVLSKIVTLKITTDCEE